MDENEIFGNPKTSNKITVGLAVLLGVIALVLLVKNIL